MEDERERERDSNVIRKEAVGLGSFFSALLRTEQQNPRWNLGTDSQI
jgi:hypothetical protein